MEHQFLSIAEPMEAYLSPVLWDEGLPYAFQEVKLKLKISKMETV